VELFGFELKPAKRGSVIGAHEAFAHTRYVHYSYLVWHVPDKDNSSAFATVHAECARLGVGLVHFADPSNFRTWSRDIEPQKQSPDLFSVDTFIDDRFDKSETVQLKAWMKEA
jgi:hypothetical protein